MLIIKYNGGLGNQIFQYIFGVSKAKELGVDVAFDMNFFKKHSKRRPYMMGIFGVESKENKDFRAPLYWTFRKAIKGNKFLGLNIYKETAFSYEEKSEKIVDNTFVEGFFQSVKYFDDEIVKNLNWKAPISSKTQEIEEDMKDKNAVSIHIRRGDYVNKAIYKEMFNELTVEHYKKAIEIIKEKVENPVFYVFSDDPEWAKNNLGIEATFPSHNSNYDSWQDMYLMSKCKHNIIANSSFSFWGAMLNKNENKIVIAPKKWFNDDSIENSTKDIYPDNWIKLA